MATKIRLQRHGRKGYAFYHVVVADSRAPRDGKFIERLGSYNPNTNPATIDLNFERALYWVSTGAQPTDTARTVLSSEGVLMMKHLLEGVKKGAFTTEQAEVKFNTWKQGKEASINATKVSLKDAVRADLKSRMEAEVETNKAKSAEIAQKLATARAEAAAAVAAAAPKVEEAPAPVAAVEVEKEEVEEKVAHVAPDFEDAPVAKEVAAEVVVEAPAPAVEEAPVVEEVAEVPAPAVEEVPAAPAVEEAPAEEKPAAE
jgi:small subunit ribosomal protein S16